MNENGRKKVVEEEDWNLCAFSFGGSERETQGPDK